MDEALEKNIKQELKLHAKALSIPEGAIDSFIKEAIPAIKKSLKARTILTKLDVAKIVAKEIRKYNKDLAYVYENHDKII